jgi:hydroxyacylglutathione hydrolase
MKKSLRTNLLSIRIVSLVLLLSSGFILKANAQTSKMEPVETKEIVHHVYAVKDDFVNLFLIQNNDEYVVIDAGSNLEAVSKELQKLKISSDKVVALFLTHTHFDHTAAIGLFKNATIYLSKQEMPITDKKSATLTLNKTTYKNTYRFLEDQQIIQVSNIKIKGILTPGHTPGSMSYLVNDKYLFVGDAFSLINGKVDKPNKDYTKDMKSAITSFEKINKLPKAGYIFTAHTGYSSDYKNAVNTQLK